MRSIVFAALLLCAGCSSLEEFARVTNWGAPAWAETGGAPQRWNRALDTVAFPLVEAVRWRASGGLGAASPLASSGFLLVPCANGVIDVFDLHRLETVGDIEVPGWIKGSPAMHDSLLFVPSARNEGELACYNLAAKAEVWRVETGIIESGLMVTARGIVSCTSGGEIACHSWDSSLVWTSTLPGGSVAAPAMDANRMYLAGDNGDICAFDLETGHLDWRHSSGAPYAAGPSTSSVGVLAINRHGRLEMLKAEDGIALWRLESGSVAYATPAMDSSHAYVALGDGRLLAVALQTGNISWTAQAEGLLNSQPLITGAHVILASRRGRITAYDRLSGREMWRTDAGAGIITAPILVDGFLIVCTSDRDVVVYRSAARQAP